jgi:DNA-binding transcriptional LysR family regulator
MQRDPPRGVPRVKRSDSSLEVRQLRTFVALVDRGSVTAAAEALGLAQSTVSESLSALERALGTNVSVRRRGFSDLLLTAAGRALLPHARAVLATLDTAQIAVAGATTAAHAVVDVVANESVSSYVLPGVLAELRRRWPNTRFAVSVATCTGVRAGVEDGAFDVGLLLEPVDREPVAIAGVERATVADEVPLVLFGGPAHPLAGRRAAGRGGAARRDALADYPLFMSDAAGDFHLLVSRFFEADGLPGPHLEATGSIEGVKRGVAADAHALGLLPAYAVADELRAGRFVRVGLEPAPPRMRLDALVSTARPRHPALAELLAGTRRMFGARVGPATPGAPQPPVAR